MEAVNSENKLYTYEDVLEMSEDIRVELLDGEIYYMSSPTYPHQAIQAALIREFGNYLKGKKCRVIAAPFDIRLSATLFGNKDNTVFQPDLVIICDLSKLDKKNGSYRGAPDMVVEILSPSTYRRDRLLKFNKYQKSGVREYWIVDPHSMAVETYVLDEGALKQHGVYESEDKVSVQILDDCTIDLNDIFAELKEDLEVDDDEE